MKKRKPRPEYEALIQKILAGEISRKQAAALSREQTGLSEQSFLSWITAFPGLKEKLKPTNGNKGANSHLAHKDPDKVKAYEDAIAEVMAGRPATLAAEKYGVNYVYLCRRARSMTLEKNAALAYKGPSEVDLATARALELHITR